jgi:soluble lytic murein transglycosylase
LQKRTKKKNFFFEKKKQKTFVCFGLVFFCCANAVAGTTMQDAVAARDWQQAEVVARGLGDPLAVKLVDYLRLLTPSAATEAEIGLFLRQNPSWPGQHQLHRLLDVAIAADSDDAAVIAACDADHPEQDIALLRCARAVPLSRRADAVRWARQAWLHGVTSPAAEASFLNDWPGVVTPDDDWQRFDALAWAGDPAAARALARLDPPRRALGAARLAFRHADPDALTIVAAVQQGQRGDAVLLLEQARWLRAHGDLADALALWRAGGVAAEAAAPAGRRPAFWQERERLARLLLAQGDATGAYFLADDAALGQDDAPDGLFLAGWIALRKLHDAAAARVKFHALAAASPAVITQGRAHYWLAEAAANDAEAARERAAAATYPTTFYGQLAAAGVAGLGDDSTRLATLLRDLHDPAWTQAAQASFNTAQLTRAAGLLANWGLTQQARQFLLRQLHMQGDAGGIALTADLAARLGLTDVAVAAARLGGKDGFVFLHAGWPVPPALQAEGPLSLGIARQESNFDAGIVSPSGAAGLMQLMQGTAMDMQRGLGLGTAPPDLFDPAQNIRLGDAYLDKLLAQFGGVAAYAVAAYNAGPRHVREWMAANGDAAAGSQAAMVDWIEQIPFAETRNYVQRVLENAAIYAAMRPR